MKFKRTSCIALAASVFFSGVPASALSVPGDNGAAAEFVADDEQTIAGSEFDGTPATVEEVKTPPDEPEEEDASVGAEKPETEIETQPTTETDGAIPPAGSSALPEEELTALDEEEVNLPQEVEITVGSKDKGASIFQLLKRAGYDADSAKRITSIRLLADDGIDEETTVEFSFSAVTKAINGMAADDGKPTLIDWCPDLETFEADSHLTIKNNKLSARVFGDPNGKVIMENLKTFRMPSITDISAAFANCTALETVELGGVMTIGAFSFQNCTALKSIIFRNLADVPYFVESDDDPEGSHFDGASKSDITIYVPDNKVTLFYGKDEQGNSVVVAEGFEEFAGITGYGENYYDESDLPDPTVELTISSFDPGKLETAIKSELGLTNKSTSAEISAAYASVKSLTITDGILTKDDCTFINNKLKKLENLLIIGNADFGTGGKDPQTTHSIPSAAFRGNKTLKYFQADNAEAVEKDALSLIPTMETLVLPKVKRIDTRAFAMLKFSNNSQLKEIYLPSLEYMNSRTFYYCVRLEKLVLGPTVPYVDVPEGKEGLWFSYATKVEVYVPGTSVWTPKADDTDEARKQNYLDEANVVNLDWSAFTLHPWENGDGNGTAFGETYDYTKQYTFPEVETAPEYNDRDYDYLREKYPNPTGEYYEGDIEISLNMYSFNSPINRAIKDGANYFEAMDMNEVRSWLAACKNGSVDFGGLEAFVAPAFGATDDENMTTIDVLKWAKENGFAAADLTLYYVPGYTNIGMPDDDTQAKIELCVRYLRLLLNKLNLAISGTGMQNSFSDATATRVQTDIERMKFYLKMGEILEAPCMRIFTGTAPVDIRRKGWEPIMNERIIPAIEEVAQYGVKEGISCKLGIQNHGDMLATGNQVLYIMDYFLEKGYTNLGVVNDTGYYREFGEITYPDEDWCYQEINRVLPVSSNFQLKKKARGAESMELIDLERIFRDIRASGYLTENCIEANGTRYVPVEVLWAPSDSDYPENAAEVVESYKTQVKAFLAKVQQMVEETKTPIAGPEDPEEPEDPDVPGNPEQPGTPQKPNKPSRPGSAISPSPAPSTGAESKDEEETNRPVEETPANRISVGTENRGSVLTVGSDGRLTETDVVYNVNTGEIVPFSVMNGAEMQFLTEKSGEYAVKSNAKQFSDLAGHWGADAVRFVTARELFTGTGGGRFAPDLPMTRAMFVTVLAKLDGVALSGRTSAFNDVRADDWFAGAVAWATETGVVSGVHDSRFDPDGEISREQMAVILSRYMEYKGLHLRESAGNIRFTDADAISSWSAEAVDRAVRTGLFSGRSDGRFDPQGGATRAEVASVLMRFIQAVVQ